MGRNLFAEHKLYFQDWPYLYAPTEDVLLEDIARWNGYVRLSTPWTGISRQTNTQHSTAADGFISDR